MKILSKIYYLFTAFFKPLKDFVPIPYQKDFINSIVNKNTERARITIKLLIPISIIMAFPDLINTITGNGLMNYNLAGLTVNTVLFVINVVYYFLFKEIENSNNRRQKMNLLKSYLFVAAGIFLVYAVYINTIINDISIYYAPMVVSMVVFTFPDYFQVFNALISVCIISIFVLLGSNNFIITNNNLQILSIATLLSLVIWRVERKHVANEYINKKMYEDAKDAGDLLNASLFEKNQKIEKQNAELLQLNATKDKFFSIVAHDIKNPLSAIVNLSSIINDMDRFELTNEEIKSYANDIHFATKNLSELLENLLVWSRSHRGIIKYSPENCKLSNLFNYVSSLLEFSASEKNIQIFNEIPSEIEIIADVNMLNTVIRNIISNSIKFTPNGGKIIGNYESINNPEPMHRLIISDTGVGIPQENINKLFKIEGNISTPGTNNETGTGLGLLICQEFINKHNGEIFAQSEAGKGTKIYIELPK